MKSILRFFCPITSIPLKRKRENPSNLRWESLDFQNFIHFQLPALFDLQKDSYGICGKLQSCRYLSLLSVTIRIRSIRNLCKKLWQKYWNSAGCFQIRIFQFWPEWIFFFPFLYSYTFDLFHVSKTMLQLILTLVFS